MARNPGAGSSASSLRLSPTEDEAFDEPAERAGRIELLCWPSWSRPVRTGEDAEDEFRPAGTIGPEVEVIDDWKYLFGDDFEHEEVIVERYAAPVVCHREPAGSASENDVAETSEDAPAAEAALSIESNWMRYEAVGKPRGAGVARRHEYRHLFAKLRHA